MRELSDFKYVARLDRDKYHLIYEIEQWCEANIGPGGYMVDEDSKWHLFQAFGYSDFSFISKQDAEWFTLRWV